MHYAEPYRIKIVQHNKPVPYHVRVKALKKAQYNVRRLPYTDVYLDLAAEKSADAMSDQQWAALMVGDEAYAGSRNFYDLEAMARQVLGKLSIIPTHMGRGAENLILRHLMRADQAVVTNKNIMTARPLTEHQGGRVIDVTVPEALRPSHPARYKGNIDLNRLETLLHQQPNQIAMVLCSASVSLLGGQILAFENFEKASAMARERDIPVVFDATHAASAAYLQKEWENLPDKLEQLVLRYTAAADIVYMSARGDAFCHTGGLVAVDDAATLTALQALVVVFEGLHTYGGQAGRDMQAFCRGLFEMTDGAYHAFRRRQFTHMEQYLSDKEIPLYSPVGAEGLVIDAQAMMPDAGDGEYCSEALAAALYLESGVRAGPYGKLHQIDSGLDLLSLSVPRRSYTDRQIDYALAAVTDLQRVRLKPFHLDGAPPLGRYELAAFRPSAALPFAMEPGHAPTVRPEPYTVKVVEPLIIQDRHRRDDAIKAAGYNPFLIRSEDVYIDLLTDSGTAAMSSEQWAGMQATAESDTGTQGYAALVDAVQQVLGYRYVLPTHQGRAAEHLLSQCAIKPGQIVVNNMYFTTTREHQEMAGGIFRDLIVDEAHDPTSQYIFKGDIDPDHLEQLIREVGPSKVAYICLEANVNMAGGQPVSMAGARRVAHIARYYGVPLYWDATRVAENAYFIKWKETGYQDASILEILRELMSYGDGCTVSAKKDLLVNIGGFLALNDEKLYRQAAALGAVYEGNPTHGGLASRDLTAMAIGCWEMTDEEYLRNRVEQVQFLAAKLLESGVPIVEPPGGHAVFLDASRFLDHLPQQHFPAQRLAAELYLESGVRSMERGIVSAGRDPQTGDHKYPRLELVRLAIPRRVYTYSHLETVADGIVALYARRHQIPGLRFVYEPPRLRFFQARFASL